MRPNFFVVGAPKCGTTALVDYLSGHPQVFTCPSKEPHFFCTDIPGLRTTSSISDYEALFEQAGPQHRAVGEGSVFYLYSTQALANIRAYAPGARVIVMLRSPAELVHSLHTQYLYSRNENVSDIAAAWALTDSRRMGHRIPRHCRDPKVLEYDRVAALGAQLESVLSVFPAEQVLWVFFEDFVQDTGRQYRRVLQFLGLEDDGRKQFMPVNQRKRHRWTPLGNFTQRPPARLVSVGEYLKRALGIKQWGILNRLRTLNTAPKAPAALPVEVKAAIIENYSEDVRRLERITGRSLDAWLAL